MGYEKAEQETVLCYEAETDTWKGYSCYSPHITKILKIMDIDDVAAEYEDGRESPLSIKFEFKSNQVSFRQGKKREISEEHKEKLRQNAIKMQEARRKNKDG